MTTHPFATPAFERDVRLAEIHAEVEQFLRPYAASMAPDAFEGMVSSVALMRLEDEEVAMLMRSGLTG